MTTTTTTTTPTQTAVNEAKNEEKNEEKNSTLVIEFLEFFLETLILFPHFHVDSFFPSECSSAF
jgi:hypothetical protein